MHQMDVVGVRVEMPSNQPIVLLREIDGERYLPIWIGAVEATAIAFAQQGVVPARPLTHDLLRDILVALGHRLTEVRITDLVDGVFFAVLAFEGGVEVSARPSDAIAHFARGPLSTLPIVCSTKPVLPSPMSRRTRSRSSASSSTRSRRMTSSVVRAPLSRSDQHPTLRAAECPMLRNSRPPPETKPGFGTGSACRGPQR